MGGAGGSGAGAAIFSAAYVPVAPPVVPLRTRFCGLRFKDRRVIFDLGAADDWVAPGAIPDERRIGSAKPGLLSGRDATTQKGAEFDDADRFVIVERFEWPGGLRPLFRVGGVGLAIYDGSRTVAPSSP